MSDKFLNTGGSGGVNISNGTTDVFAATISAANLDPSRPVKTNSTKTLVSSNLDISDVNNLQSELNRKIKLNFINGGTPANPPAGEVSLYSKTNDSLYYKTSGGIEKFIGSGAPPGIQTSWFFSTNTTIGIPAPSYFRLNNADPLASTEIAFDVINTDTNNISPILNTMKNGDKFVMSNADGSNIKIYRVTNSVNEFAYHTYNITLESYSNASAYNDGDLTIFTFYPANHSSTTINMLNVGNPTYKTVQNLQDIFHSSGWSFGGAVSDAGGGFVDVSEGEGFIRDADNTVNPIYFMKWQALTGLALTDLSLNYIYVEYNGGSPQIVATTTERTDVQTNTLMGRVYRDGTTLTIDNLQKDKVADHAGNMIRRLHDLMPFAHSSGASISVKVLTRSFLITEGNFWRGLTKITTPSYDSSVTNFAYWYDRADWKTLPPGGEINNSQWDNLGFLDNLEGKEDKWRIDEVYIDSDGKVDVVLGNDEYKSEAEAIDAVAFSPKNVLPPELFASTAVGITIIQGGSTTINNVLSPFVSSISTGGVSTIPTLQDVYNQSTPPQIKTNGTSGPLVLQEDTTVDATDVLQIKNNDGLATTFSVTGEGKVDLGGLFPLTSATIDIGAQFRYFKDIHISGEVKHQILNTHVQTTNWDEIDVSTITGITGTNKYAGGTIGFLGKIYCAPSNSSNVLVIDPETNTTSTFSHGVVGTNLCSGAIMVRATSLRYEVYFIPQNSTSVIRLNTLTNAIDTPITGLVGTDKWDGAVLAPNNNKIYCIPKGSPNVLVINPVNNTTTTIAHGVVGTNLWSGGVVAPNGKIYCAPSEATVILVIDPTNDTVSTFTYPISGSIVGGSGQADLFRGCVLAPNGKIYCIPYNSLQPLIIVPTSISPYPTTDFAYIIPGQLNLPFYLKWKGGCLAPNGKIYCVPSGFGETDVLVIDPVDDSLKQIPISDPSTPNNLPQKYHGLICSHNSSLYGIPHSSEEVMIINPNQPETVSLNRCISSYYNKY